MSFTNLVVLGFSINQSFGVILEIDPNKFSCNWSVYFVLLSIFPKCYIGVISIWTNMGN